MNGSSFVVVVVVVVVEPAIATGFIAFCSRVLQKKINECEGADTFWLSKKELGPSLAPHRFSLPPAKLSISVDFVPKTVQQAPALILVDGNVASDSSDIYSKIVLKIGCRSPVAMH